jgi:CheY-like chemotaxis protein
VVGADAATEELADLAGMLVLVVDDDDNSRRMLKAALRRCGADVETADCVATAREAIARRKPHVIVTDIAMPGEDGLALVREVRASEETRCIPVFALSAFRQRDELLKEFDAFLHKPMDPMDIARRIGTRRAQG